MGMASLKSRSASLISFQAADSSSLFSASLSRGFLIGGQSSGANLAAVIAHRARDDAFFAERRLTGQVLQVPIVLHPDAYPEK